MYVAIDLGGTQTRVGLQQDLRSPQQEIIDRFSTEVEYGRQIARMIDVISRNCRKRIRGIGISVGARVALDGTMVRSSVNLRDYVQKPIVRQLSQKFGCPVKLAHDGVCGVLAETTFGALGGYDRCAYLTVSTGTGAAIQLRKGTMRIYSSIEMGHQIVAGNPKRCLCGQTGCLETITGGKQILMQYGRNPSEITDDDFWRDFTEHLALGIVNLSALTRIDAIAVSGGIALNSSYVREHLRSRVFALRDDDECEVLWSQIGEDAPLVGATLLLATPEESVLH